MGRRRRGWRTRMPRGLFVVFEVLQRASHAEVQAQPELAIGAYKQMFAMTPTRFEAAPFQSARKLKRSSLFQDVCVTHINIVDTLMQ